MKFLERTFQLIKGVGPGFSSLLTLQSDQRRRPPGGGGALSDEEKAVADRLGHSADAFAAARG